MRRLYTVDIEERPTRWSETQRVRGGGSGTLDRLIVFVGLLFFCAALVTGVVGSVVYVVKTGANVRQHAGPVRWIWYMWLYLPSLRLFVAPQLIWTVFKLGKPGSFGHTCSPVPSHHPIFSFPHSLYVTAMS